jgi:hypothetical protein
MKFSVVLLKYTSEAGIEKRGYAARSAVRSLADADEPNE